MLITVLDEKVAGRMIVLFMNSAWTNPI